MQTIRQQPRQFKVKGIADVVFCLDASGSMAPCLEGVKQHIGNFVEGLASNQQISDLDLRLGLLAYDDETFYILNFTNDLSVFKNALEQVSTGTNELTLPALDWSLDFNWRDTCQKIVVVFTDEPLETGHDPDFQRSKLEELKQKIIQLRAMVYFVGPDCPEYRQINDLPRCIFEPIKNHEDFFTVGFNEVLKRIGKTLSGSIGRTPQGAASIPKKDLYNISQQINQVRLG